MVIQVVLMAMTMVTQQVTLMVQAISIPLPMRRIQQGITVELVPVYL